MLVSIMNPLVTLEAIIQQAVQLVPDLGETEWLWTRRDIQTSEGMEVLPVTKTRRPTPQAAQLGPLRVIWAGIQLVKIDHQPDHVLLQLWRQLKDKQKFQNHPTNPGVRTIDKLPTTTWNWEGFLVPSKRKKPPQVSWATMPEPPEEKVAIAQLTCVTGDASPPVTRASRRIGGPMLSWKFFGPKRTYKRLWCSLTHVETSIIYGDLTKFNGDKVMICGFGVQTIPVTQMWLKLGVGCLPPRERKISIAPVPEYILGIDILWGLAFQTTVREFGLWQRCVSVRVEQVILRGHVKHESICLRERHGVTNVRQYRLPWGQDEISRTVQELEKVGIIRSAHSP